MQPDTFNKTKNPTGINNTMGLSTLPYQRTKIAKESFCIRPWGIRNKTIQINRRNSSRMREIFGKAAL